MIFVTVGTQLAFDRLVDAVDRWSSSNPDVPVFAQIGESRLNVRNLKHSRYLTPKEVKEHCVNAKLIVAHAGMGSILTALTYRKPILIMPRKAELGEHRNDHQVATARWLKDRPSVIVAWNEVEVIERLNDHMSFLGGDQIPPFASSELIEHLRTFIQS